MVEQRRPMPEIKKEEITITGKEGREEFGVGVAAEGLRTQEESTRLSVDQKIIKPDAKYNEDILPDGTVVGNPAKNSGPEIRSEER